MEPCSIQNASQDIKEYFALLAYQVLTSMTSHLESASNAKTSQSVLITLKLAKTHPSANISAINIWKMPQPIQIAWIQSVYKSKDLEVFLNSLDLWGSSFLYR